MTIKFDHKEGEVEPLIKFCRRETDRLRSRTKIIIGPSRTVIHDFNRDTMELAELTFRDPALEALLKDLGVVYDTKALKSAAAEGREVEYPLSARYPWAWDRVMG